MTITLTGSNAFQLQQELKQLTAKSIELYGDMAVERLDGEEASYDAIRQSLESLPFLASKKVVILRNPSAQSNFVEHVEQLVADLPETTDLIIVEPKLDKRSSYYKFLKKSTDFREWGEQDTNQLAGWLVQLTKESEGSLSQSDARYLIERLGTNQQMLANELNKLLTYDATISRDTINLLTEPNPQSTIFQLLDASFAGNQKEVIKLYQEQRANKVEPHAIIGLLAWQLHALVLVKAADNRSDTDIAQAAKLSPYVIKKSRGILRGLSLAHLKQLVGDLATLDQQLKTSAIDADDAVQAYLLSI